jgi:putative methyltransferase (TIGR04325 family)
VLAALLWVAAKNQGRLNVVDFGGSLGTSYFQNKRFLDALPNVSWNVVEQENFVKVGGNLIADERLHFFQTINESVNYETPDLLLLSCSLHYMKEPYQLIQQLIQFNVPYIFVDNTPFNYEERDRITMQKVPPSIYTASYPCWFLSYEKVKASFEKNYTIVSQHHNDSVIELDGRKLQYKGFFLELKP